MPRTEQPADDTLAGVDACFDLAAVETRREEQAARSAITRWTSTVRRDLVAAALGVERGEEAARSRVARGELDELDALCRHRAREMLGRDAVARTEGAKRVAVEQKCSSEFDSVVDLHRARLLIADFLRPERPPAAADAGQLDSYSGAGPREEATELTGADTDGGVTYYLLAVRYWGRAWTTRARYSAFATLRDGLQQRGVRVPASFPGKTQAAVGQMFRFGSLGRGVLSAAVQERKRLLNVWLQAAVTATHQGIENRMDKESKELQSAAAFHDAALQQLEANRTAVLEAQAARCAERRQWFADWEEHRRVERSWRREAAQQAAEEAARRDAERAAAMREWRAQHRARRAEWEEANARRVAGIAERARALRPGAAQQHVDPPVLGAAV